MKTIKIARVVTGCALSPDDQVFAPYGITKENFDHWYTWKQAQKLFNSMTWENFKHEDSNGCDEVENPEMELISAYRNGYKPHLWLHSFEISEYVWKNKERLAAYDGYEDIDRWLTEIHTNYHWNYEGCREVQLPHDTLRIIEAASFLTDNAEEIKELFIKFVADTGNPDNLSENEFRCFLAECETEPETILN